MKTPNSNEHHDAANVSAVKKQTKVEMRLVSRPDQKALREWEITLPDDLVAVLTMGDI